MAEPHVTGTATVVGLAAAPPLVLLGAQIDALVVGLAASILVTFWMEQIDSKVKAGSAMIFSALLAGYGSPVAADVAAGVMAAQFPTAVVDMPALRMLLAFVLGAAAPYLVPLLIRRAGRQIDGGAK